MAVFVVLILASGLALGPSVGCRCREGGPATKTGEAHPRSESAGYDLGVDAAQAERSLIPEHRELGPRRPERPEEIAAERRRARVFTKTLGRSLNRREVTALADIRGYRLYKHRYFGRAHEWFLAAVDTDPRFELSLYNAARTAALLGHVAEAQAFLTRLQKLATPLARQRLILARTDPDLAGVHLSAVHGSGSFPQKSSDLE